MDPKKYDADEGRRGWDCSGITRTNHPPPTSPLFTSIGREGVGRRWRGCYGKIAGGMRVKWRK